MVGGCLVGGGWGAVTRPTELPHMTGLPPVTAIVAPEI